MNKKLNKFKLKRLFLLVIALAGIVVQAKATYYAKMTVHVGKGSGTVYVGESGQTSQTLSTGTKGGNITFTLGANASTGYSFAGWYSDSDCTNSANGTVAASTANGGTAEYNRYAKFVTYYAKMTVSKSGQGTVKVENQDGPVTKNTGTSGGSISFNLTATPSTGYRFVGWYADSGCTNRVSTSATWNCSVSASSTEYGTASYTRYAKFISADTWNEDLLSGATYTVTTDGDRFKVSCSNTNSYNHNLTFLYVGNITANSGTATINFNNTQPLKVNGLFKVNGSATLTLNKTNNNNVTLIRKDRTGNLFEIAASGRLNVNGYSSSAMFIVDGGTVFGTEYDARTPMTTTGATGKMFYVLGHLTMQYAILQNGNGICINANSSSTDNTKYEMKLDNVKIRGFYAQDGAAVYLQSQDYHNAVFTNVTISGCKSHATDNSGGGTIRTNGGVRSTLTLDNCTIEYCYSGEHGGGVYWNASGIPGETKIIIKNSTKIRNNEAGIKGGGIFVESEMELESVIIDNNIADQGGGIFLSTYQGGADQYSGDGYSLYVTENVEITNNTARSSGGGAYMYIRRSNDIGFNPAGNPIDATFQLVMSGGKISGNHAPVGAGVSINDCAPKKYIVSNILSGTYIRKVKISGGEIKDNICTNTKDNVKGAGIYIRKYKDSAIDYSAVGGAGLMEVSISGGNICSNIARNDNGNGVGGGFYINNEMSQEAPYYSKCTIKIDGTVHVSGNECDGNGAGIYVENGDIDITGGIVGENGLPNISHQGNGAGVYVGNGKITISKGNVDYNQARYSNGKGGYGGAFYLTGGTVTISGGGSVSHNIAHKDGGGIFVNAPSSSSVTTIQGGATVASNEAVNGAGVFVSQGLLTITGDGTNIKSNIASNNGGGLFTNNGTITISDQAKLSSNSAINGAGLYSGGGEINVTGKSKIDGNTATGNGGAVYITNGTVTISDGTIGDENTANGNKAAIGGGIYASGGTIQVINQGKVLGNTATSNGGGIYAGSGNITVKGDGTKISYNSAANGGGLFANSGSITIDEKAELSYNTANNGAGLYAAGGDLTVKGEANLNHNEATSNGGGIYSNAGLTFTNATMENNIAKNGAGAFVNATLDLDEATIQNNTASNYGGGVYVNKKLTLSKSTISGNTAALDGGGFYGGNQIDISSSTISSNTATGNGGGIYSAGAYPINLTDNSNIVGNNAVDGAGIYIKEEAGSISMTGGSIKENIASRNGGGVYLNSGNVDINDTKVQENRAVNGGGFYLGGGSVKVNIGTEILENRAEQNGAGLYFSGGSLTVNEGSKISSNIAEADGGGLYFSSNDDIELKGGELSDNKAANGGGVYVAQGTLTLSGSTIKSNIVGTNGGGVYVKDGATFEMSGGSFAENKANNGGGLYVGGTATLKQGWIRSNTAHANGGGAYVAKNATLNLLVSARIEQNTARAHGGGVYMNGAINVGGNELTVYNNKISRDVQNNVYLPDAEDVVTIIDVVEDGVVKYHGVQGDVKLGITISGENLPKAVIHSETPSNDGHLEDLIAKMIDPSQNSQIVDDESRYQSVYAPAPSPYNLNDIFFTRTWQAEVADFEPSDVTAGYFDNIDTDEKLAVFMCYVNGLNKFRDAGPHQDAKGVLTADIDMGRCTWIPIGAQARSHDNPLVDTDTPYKAEFDGQGHVVSGLIAAGLIDYANYGFFGSTNTGANIHDLFVTDCAFSSTMAGNVGCIAGDMHDGIICNSEGAGILSSNVSDCRIGGLVGHLEKGNIHSSMAMADMTGMNSTVLGGLAGETQSGTTIKNCFANPKFAYNGENNDYIGGLVAKNAGTVENCYVRFERSSAYGNAKFGQFAGSNTGSIAYCYAPASGNFVKEGTAPANSGTYGIPTPPYSYNYDAASDPGNVLMNSLNEWVNSNGGASATYSSWRRTMAGSYTTTGGDINDDYPIHLFSSENYTGIASKDGIVLDYYGDLSTMLKRHNADGCLPGGCISLWKDAETNLGTDGNLKVYIDENVSLIQTSTEKTINAYTCQTLTVPAGSERWHLIASSLTASPIGIEYDKDTEVGPSSAPNPCEASFVSGADADDQCLFPSDADIENTDLYCFYEPHYHWINFRRNSLSHWHMDADMNIPYENEEALVPGKGYLASIDKQVLLQAGGVLNNGDISIPVTSEASNELKGYNLIGNPYQSYLSFSKFAESNQSLWKDGETPSYVVYDPKTDCYVPGSAVTPSKGSRAAGGDFSMHQGFFVIKTGNATTARFSNDMRTNTPAEGTSFRKELLSYPVINIMVEGESGESDLAVAELRRPEFDGTAKMKRIGSLGKTYFHYENEDYALLYLNKNVDHLSVYFETEEPGTYTMSWSTANAEFSYLHLIDNLTGMDVDMLNSDNYVFVSGENDYKSRFKLVFHYDFDEEQTESHISNFAFVNGGDLIVNGEGDMEVIDMNGHVILRTRLTDSQSRVSIPEVAAGVYVIRLNEKSQKIVIWK